MAALVVARRAVTLVPGPFAGVDRASVERAARSSPRFVELLESWRWSIPLWHAGVISGGEGGEEPSADVRASWTSLREDPRLGALRALSREGLFETQEEYLSAIARDVLRAGPDPGISLPVAAGLDRFASRLGLVPVRSAPVSVAQREEARLGARVFHVGVLLPVQASAERVLQIRESLGDEIGALAEAIGHVAHGVAAGASAAEASGVAVPVAGAAGALSRAMESCEHARGANPDELHLVVRACTLSGMILPADAVLRSSEAAMRSIGSTRGPSRREALPVIYDAVGARPLLSVVVRVLGARGVP